MTHTATSVDLFDRWFSINMANVGEHALMICKENAGSIDDIIEDLRNVMRSHYVAPEITSKRLAELGALKTAELLKEHLPTAKARSADPEDVRKATRALKKARSGDFGEILATEITERKLGFDVPVRRLRYKDGRNMALRGDDIIAVARDPAGRLKFLKGESKSRVKLTSTVVKEAAEALDRDFGRPSRHSAVFIAERLREAGDDKLASDIEIALLDSFRKNHVDHLLFTVSGNDPNKHLSDHLSSCMSRARQHAVGVRIINHGEFIERLFSEI